MIGPGNWLGMIGGGQLGRMFAHAAQAMGYKVCVLDPDPNSPAGTIAERHICAGYTDEAALAEMAALEGDVWGVASNGAFFPIAPPGAAPA